MRNTRVVRALAACFLLLPFVLSQGRVWAITSEEAFSSHAGGQPVAISQTADNVPGWQDLPNTEMQTVCPQDNFQPPGGGMPAYDFYDFCRGVVTSWTSA